MTLGSMLRRPSGFVPLLMSLAACGLVAAVLLTVGVTRPEDEQAPARLFQLLIALQVPLVACFAFRHLPESPRAALVVLGLQLTVALLAVAWVIWLESRVPI